MIDIYFVDFSSLAEIDLKTASKFFAGKFSCGASIAGEDEIVIQGDVKDDLFDILPEKWSIVSIIMNIACLERITIAVNSAV